MRGTGGVVGVVGAPRRLLGIVTERDITRAVAEDLAVSTAVSVFLAVAEAPMLVELMRVAWSPRFELWVG